MSFPLSRGTIIVGRVAPIFVLGCLQLVLLLTGASLALDYSVTGNKFVVAIVALLTVAVAVGFGVVLTAIADTMNKMSQMAYLLLLAGGSFGGAFVPIDLLPTWARWIGFVFPQRWSIDALRQLSEGAPVGDVTVHVVVLTGMVIALAVGAMRLFDLDRVSSR